MGVFNWLNRNNPRYTSQKWEDTEEGKRFYEKCLTNAEKRLREKEEWERNTPPEIKEQVKIFKILITILLFLFAGVLLWGFKTGRELWVLLGEFIFSGASLALFFIKPKFVKYPNCFMMPVIAMCCMVLLYIFMSFEYGFNPKTRNDVNKIQDYEETDFSSEEEAFNNDYSRWLLENNLIDKADLEESIE